MAIDRDSLPVIEGEKWANITATTAVASGNGRCIGIFVASASGSPTIVVGDDTTTVVNTFTPVAATFYRFPFEFNTSLKVTIGGTVDCTVFWS